MGTSRALDLLRAELDSLEAELRRHEERRERERAIFQARLDVLAEHATSEAGRADRLRESVRALEHELATVRAQRETVERRRRALEAEVEYRKRDQERQAQQLQQQDELLNALTTGLGELKADIERVAASRAWRVGHGLARSADRLRLRHRVTGGAVDAALTRARALERKTAALQAAGRSAVEGPGGSPRAGIDDAGRAQLARRIRSQLGPAPKRARWPTVSIVVLNRNGEEHLRRLLPGLINDTGYPHFDLIVVDNASTDGSLEYLHGLSLPFGLEIVANTENVSFSVGNQQGAQRATGEFLLLLNNDVQPFERGWLRELVAVALRPGVGIAGATLLHGLELAGGVPAVQHRGIRVRYSGGRFVPYNLDDGGSLFGDQFGVDVESPATTGACLMVRRELFDRLGGLPEAYRYGTEDVDLGFQVLAGGDAVVTSGRAHLLHRESSTQDAAGREFKRNNRLNNQRVFAERWAARLRREYRLSRLRGDGYWADSERPLIAITVTSNEVADGWGDWYTAHELGDALERIGWRVTYAQRRENEWYSLPDELDYLLVLIDAYDLRNVTTDATTIAWVRNWTERWLERPWFGSYDLVLASSRRSCELIEARAGVQAIRFPLATNPERFTRVDPDPDLTADYVFTGNYWQHERAIEKLDPRPGETFRLFGNGWHEVPELAPYAQGSLPYDRLPAAYSSARVVIDDTAHHALPYEAVNSRVFDALSCGTIVLSNCEAGVQELFDQDFPVWSDGDSLRAGLDRLLTNEPLRERLATRYAQLVREHHTYDVRARQLARALTDLERRPSFCIKTGAPSRAVAAEWGDVHYAEALAGELRRRGHRCVVQTLDEWEQPAALQYDVVVHLKGLSRYQPKAGQFNVLWNISHPERLTDEECEAYDLVCVASTRFAAELRSRVSVPVAVLEQATDPHVFYPDPDPRYRHELVFVANSRKVMRRMMADLLPTDFDLAVYGSNWEGLIDERYIAGHHVPNTELRKVYSSASIVLNDHWDDMREHGFLSNRIYDALACGAVVLSDDMPELVERFGDAVVTYSDASELPQLIERLLRSPEERARRGAQGRELVLNGYTFMQRAGELLALIDAHREQHLTIRPEATPAGTAAGAKRRRRGLPWRRAELESDPSPALSAPAE
jgi:O-antigen biosynthesis protein